MQSSKSQNPLLDQMLTRETPPDWSLVLALFFVAAFVVAWIAGQIIVSTLAGEAIPSANSLAVGGLVGCVAIALAVLLWARRSTSDWADALHLRQPRNPPLFLVVLIGLAAAWAIDLVAVLLKLKGDLFIPPLYDTLAQPIGSAWVAVALFTIVFQPVAEGLVFYGILYPALVRDTNSNLIAVLLVAVVYAVVNGAILSGGQGGPWFALAQPFLMALIVGLVRAYSKSTQSAIVARSLFGLFIVLAALISVRA
ncbi:MAG TPA: CPBP family glutamic-type intramembrane protease [Aggregatilineales bacterium]|nr:CPBP family glutamic-type intramembrane protease [Aggregatilineales bacterium]